jgi:alpha-amylase/alpha-mannosidase (GH57 family)
MAFTMEMIPALLRHGYQYVIVDSVHIKPKKPLGREEWVYRTHVAEHDGARITIVPRDRDLSNAQESGLDAGWFEGEVKQKTVSATKNCLVTTWTDGENGGWFRQTDEGAGFWGHFFSPYMERVRAGQIAIRPVSLSDFVAENPPVTEVDVQTGAWNVGSTSGYDFSQWAGSPAQRDALEEVWKLSRAFQRIKQELPRGKELEEKLGQLREQILRTETSCYLFWGESWIPKLYQETNIARQLLRELEEVQQR